MISERPRDAEIVPGLFVLFNLSSSIFKNTVLRLALKPRGGSFVILTETCMTATGKCGDGFDVNHNRKDSCT